MELDVIKGITKYINTMFSPDMIGIDSLGDGKYVINVIYSKIDDEKIEKYLGPHKNVKGISKAGWLSRVIAMDVYKFWGVLSWGVSTREYPYGNDDLRINVYIKK